MRSIQKIVSPSERDLMDIQNSIDVSKLAKLVSENKKLLVFDLDETLIHCEPKNYTLCEHIIEISDPSNQKHKIGINIRPYSNKILSELKKHFVLVVYTASHQLYADPIIDLIDKGNRFFSMRLYRNNCFKTKLDDETIYVKDLRVFNGIELKNIIIIDNSVLSFSFQLDNGIPILPFYDNKQDNEFLVLMNYLVYLNSFDDVRVENKKYIKLDFFLKCANEDQEEIQDNTDCTPIKNLPTSKHSTTFSFYLESQRSSTNNNCIDAEINNVTFNLDAGDITPISRRSDRSFKMSIEEVHKNFYSLFKKSEN